MDYQVAYSLFTAIVLASPQAPAGQDVSKLTETLYEFAIEDAAGWAPKDMEPANYERFWIDVAALRGAIRGTTLSLEERTTLAEVGAIGRARPETQQGVFIRENNGKWDNAIRDDGMFLRVISVGREGNGYQMTMEYFVTHRRPTETYICRRKFLLLLRPSSSPDEWSIRESKPLAMC